MVERTFLSVGPLRIVAGVILMIGAGIAEIGFSFRSIERNTGMSIGFEWRPAVRAGDRLRINRLMAARTTWHSAKFNKLASGLIQKCFDPSLSLFSTAKPSRSFSYPFA
jgi:hypothetical protein